MSSRIKPTAITRAGYDYQDLAGIEVLIRHFRDPHLYAWIKVEADETDFKALDDVVAAKKDGSFELVQVKFTVDPHRFELDWDWLLEKTPSGSSKLSKWAKTFSRVSAMGSIHTAGLKTNRSPSTVFAKCLVGNQVNLELLPIETRKLVEAECGGQSAAEIFFSNFKFWEALPSLDEYESYLREQLVPTDTDMHGWLLLRDSVKRWATYQNQPEPDGKILREHIIQLITKRRSQPIRQDFAVPENYIPPSEIFHQSMQERISDNKNPVTVLWGTPGRGKSTYLSYLTQELKKVGAAITRHHYYLSGESSSNRTSFMSIAESLLDQLYISHPGAMTDNENNNGNLRASLSSAAIKFAALKQRLFIIIDGLDHVWRDTRRVDQLNHLFNELLPLPENVSLIVGTQRVSDDQLPGRLLAIADENDWFEIPHMSDVAVHRWIVNQDAQRPLILRFDPSPERRVEIIDEVATSFFKISQGHPLHLIYAYEAIIRLGRPTSAEEILLMPSCPDGDIREYYRGLWASLRAEAKNALHMLAGSDFFWPSLGIRQVIGDFSQIEHLLEPQNIGMVPFHPSIFSWVRERQDHPEYYQVLLPKIIAWLESEAEEYWQWGWLWLVKAQDGDFTDLLAGTTRDWVVDSLTKGWPDQQIEKILAAAETKTFQDGDFARTVTLRSLKVRVSNAREFQARDFAAYRAVALAVSDNRQQSLNILDEIYDLTDSEVAELALHGPETISSQILPACHEELIRRLNAWIALRHRPHREFETLFTQILTLSAQMEVGTVKRLLKYLLQLKKPKDYLSEFITLMDRAQNISGLKACLVALAGEEWVAERCSIQDALLRAASFIGADAKEFISIEGSLLSPFAACWFLWKDRSVKLNLLIPNVPPDLIKERYALGPNNDLVRFFYDAFWSALYTSICAEEHDFSWVFTGIYEEDLGWLEYGLKRLEDIAQCVAQGEIPPSYSTVYEYTNDLEPVRWGSASEKNHAQYRAFVEGLRQISIDLHYLGITDPGNTAVPAKELLSARQSVHWSDEAWIAHSFNDRASLFAKEGVSIVLAETAAALSAKVTEFSERSENWTHLAGLAYRYHDDKQTEYLAHASECLVGYGWRKDLWAFDMLDAVVELGSKEVVIARKRLDILVPIVEMITEFTDGDETRHLRTELIEAVAKLAPDCLPSLYAHHLAEDNYSHADACLIEFAKIIDLESLEGSALARTFIDDRTLSVLEQRSGNEPVALTLLETQNAFLGRMQPADIVKATTDEQLSDHEMEAAKVDPKTFEMDDFQGVAKAASDIHYKNRHEFMTTWLNHWKNQGRAAGALSSIRSLFEASEITYGADEILDEAFRVSLAVEGKNAAYSWIVRAHIHRHGWQSYYTSETEIQTRLGLVAQHYPDRWKQYIYDTSLPAPYFRRRNSSFVIGQKYLVRFLMMVGQIELADKVTTAFIDTFVEEVREQPIPDAPWFH